jgi:hypothetical protein
MTKLPDLTVHIVVHEYSERIYAQRGTKLRISRLINNGPTWKICRTLLSIQDGLDETKKTFHATIPLIASRGLKNRRNYVWCRNKHIVKGKFLACVKYSSVNVTFATYCTRWRKALIFACANTVCDVNLWLRGKLRFIFERIGPGLEKLCRTERKNSKEVCKILLSRRLSFVFITS